jgi:hypothetical protein
MAELVRDAGILRGRELARLTESHNQAIKAERSPITKLLLLNAYIRQLLTKIREAIKTYGADDPRGKRDIALDSQQARLLFSGAGSEPVSRK